MIPNNTISFIVITINIIHPTQKLALYIVQIAKALHFARHAHNNWLMAIFNFLISQL
jgi:hypothetical protein